MKMSITVMQSSRHCLRCHV